MTFEPILNAPLAVQIHVYTVVPAFVLGAFMFWARKGTRVHKLLGRVWVALMAITALASFFIHEIRMVGDFSPIHLLSILTLFSCGFIVWTARKRRFSAHRKTVLALYWGGIGLAGAYGIRRLTHGPARPDTNCTWTDTPARLRPAGSPVTVSAAATDG